MMDNPLCVRIFDLSGRLIITCAGDQLAGVLPQLLRQHSSLRIDRTTTPQPVLVLSNTPFREAPTYSAASYVEGDSSHINILLDVPVHLQDGNVHHVTLTVRTAQDVQVFVRELRKALRKVIPLGELDQRCYAEWYADKIAPGFQEMLEDLLMEDE